MHSSVPTRTPATSQPRLGAMHRNPACKACPRSRSAHVRVCNKYSGEASAFLLSRGGSPVVFSQAGGSTNHLAWPPRPVRGIRPRSGQRGHVGFLDNISNLFSTCHILFPLSSLLKESSTKSGLPMSSTLALQCAGNNWIAKIAETDPREPLGTPQGVTVGVTCDRSPALQQHGRLCATLTQAVVCDVPKQPRLPLQA